jgi:hypothetical protein
MVDDAIAKAKAIAARLTAGAGAATAGKYFLTSAACAVLIFYVYRSWRWCFGETQPLG